MGQKEALTDVEEPNYFGKTKNNEIDGECERTNYWWQVGTVHLSFEVYGDHSKNQNQKGLSGCEQAD
jgi:hypothetical protein